LRELDNNVVNRATVAGTPSFRPERRRERPIAGGLLT